MLQADEAKASKPTDKIIDLSLAAARKHANFVAKITSEYQEEAQSYVAQLGGPVRTATKGGEVRTFDDAKTLGKEAIDAMQTASLLVRELPAQIGREADSAKKADLQQKLKDAQAAVSASVDDALGYCRTALALANEETELADVNFIRYLLCFLHYTKQNYFDSALLGEFVARRYPDSAGARQSAKIAMASYLQLYNENKTADKAFEADRIVGIAEFIATAWPDQPEAEEALGTLVPFMINAGELERALAFVARIPESSPKRGEAELKTGQALWGTYLKGLNELLVWERDGVPAGVDVNARTAELEGIKAKALEILATGYGRVQQRNVADRTTAVALLSLAQVHVESEQPLKAIEVLEHATLGPLKLVADKHPVAVEPSFVEEAYKTALRAYIGAIPVASDRAAMQVKAQDTMNKMKDAIGQQPDGQQRLIAVFVSLARSVEEQLKVAQPGVKKVLSDSFESFLIQIRSESKDFNVLNWVAETFNGLGGGFDKGNTLTPEAKRFYDESASTFAKILAEVQLDDQMKTQMHVRLAYVSRRKRDFKQAIDTYREVLATNNMLVNVQVEAARTYQEWAAGREESVFYERAIGGSYPDKSGKNIIWGWGRISQIAAKYPNFRDTFHEACINLAVCRVLLAEKKQGAEKDKLLQSAFNGITVVYRLLPDLGGDKWKPQYNSVLVQIQKAQGVAPEGLRALPAPTRTSEPTSEAPAVTAASVPGRS
jgi:tetratricopeptide (TPR) repeat protein